MNFSGMFDHNPIIFWENSGKMHSDQKHCYCVSLSLKVKVTAKIQKQKPKGTINIPPKNKITRKFAQ